MLTGFHHYTNYNDDDDVGDGVSDDYLDDDDDGDNVGDDDADVF